MRQLLGAWAAGSLTLGTVALIFVANGHGDAVVQPLVSLRGYAFLVLLLNAALLVALATVSGHSWLGPDFRGRALWTLVVLVGGLAGWGYAATVVTELHWTPWLLIVLAYVGGGLPFAIVAAVLAQQASLAGWALGTALVLLLVGALLVVRPGVGLFGVVRLCAENLALLFAEPVVPL